MKKQKIINNDLKSLIEKFSDTDVIPTIERNYTKEAIVTVSIDQIDDSQFIKKAKISEKNVYELEENIKVNGVTRPLVVRPLKGRFEIVIGRRMFIACKLIRYTDVPVVIQNYSDEESLLILLADTLEQRSYNIVEVAYILYYLKNNFHYKNRELAKLIKSSASQVSNILQLLTLPKEILKDLVNGNLTYGHAKAISRLSQEEALELKNKIIDNELSVRETEDLVRNSQKKVEFCRVFVENNRVFAEFKTQKDARNAAKKIEKLLNENKDL